MGLIGNLLGKKSEQEKQGLNTPDAKGESDIAKKNLESDSGEDSAEGKYSEPCSLCGNPGTERKWMGKHWHKQCIRRAKKAAKGML